MELAVVWLMLVLLMVTVFFVLGCLCLDRRIHQEQIRALEIMHERVTMLERSID